MKAIKNILRKVDVFSVPLSFSYKNEDKYSTSFGGFIFILFVAVVLVVGIYYFIPFAARKNYTLVYYSMKLPTAERIKLKESKAAFALGFDCRTASDGTKAEDILDLQLNYLIYKKYSNGTKKKTEVKRKYQKFMEFYADASSLLIALFELLFVILTFINNFYAKYSISKKIFLFKEVESHHFDFSLNHHKIKKLIALTDPYKDILPNTTTPNANKNVNLAKEENIKALEKEEIKIVNININDEVEKGQEEKQLERKKIILRTSRKNSKKLTFANKEHTELQTVRSLKNEIMSVDRFNSKPVFISSRVEDFIIDSPEYQNKIKYTFNVFEIIAHYCFFCCLTKNMKLKRELNLKANSILNYKLDIILYTRNMILLDIMNKLLLDQDKKSIINFLTRPTLYSKKEVETEYDKFYNNYSGKDFNNLSEEISNLAEKSDKLMTEKKLISLSNKILKELI